MIFLQKEIVLPEFSRGFHLITGRIIKEFPEINKIKTGLSHLFIKHTSAGLTMNENADPSVRDDFESYFNMLVAERSINFRHDEEGPDDMPAHLKSSIIGHQLTIPISSGKLNLGIWQGIYLCEFRNNGGRRILVITAYGE